MEMKDFTKLVHPDLQAVIPMLQSVLMNDDNVQQVREMTNAMIVEVMKNLPVNEEVSVEHVKVSGFNGGPEVSVTIYRSRNESPGKPVVLSVHGGGLVSGSVLAEEAQNINLAQSIDGIVVSPEYRLAPECPYPAPLDDCYAALLWIAENTENLGVDPDKIFLNGASAGATLAAGCAVRAAKEKSVKIAAQFLAVPMLDYRNLTPSSYEIEDLRVWNRLQNIWCWEKYLGDLDRTRIPEEASPALLKDFSIMPPTLIMQGSADIFRDEAIAFAADLMRAGVEVLLHIYPGMFHGCEAYAPTAKIVMEYNTVRMNAIRKFMKEGYF